MRCSVFIATSIDGFIAREDDGLDWLPDPSASTEDYGYKEFFATVDVMVMGRRTYEVMLGFPGPWYYGSKPMVILTSRDELPMPSDPVANVRTMRPDDVRGVHAALQAEGFTHAYVDGGATIRGFLDAGLIDDITLTLIPVMLGRGLPLFAGVDGDRRLTLRSAQSYDSGLVQLKYVPQGKD